MANSWNQAVANINKAIVNTLVNEMADATKKEMRRQIIARVYKVYEPKRYKRQMDDGGLSDVNKSMYSDIVGDNTLKVKSQRIAVNEDYGELKDVGQIVESGKGYTRKFPFYGKPREFTKPTIENLRSTKKLSNALKKGLRRNGLKVR